MGTLCASEASGLSATFLTACILGQEPFALVSAVINQEGGKTEGREREKERAKGSWSNGVISSGLLGKRGRDIRQPDNGAI